MDLESLFELTERVRSRKKLSSGEEAFVCDVVPSELANYPDLELPKSIRHPAGFSVSGAPVGTFVRCALLIAGKEVYGKRYRDSGFYESVEKDLAFRIMRSNFHNGYPKGTHCCVQCTFAVYTVLEAGAIRYFDCKKLSQDVAQIIQQGEWRFSKPSNSKMLNWALRLSDS